MTDEWRMNAACRTSDPEVFFPESSSAHAAAEAKSICARCPAGVVTRCAREALTIHSRGVHGVWAGQYFSTTTQGRKAAFEAIDVIAGGNRAPIAPVHDISIPAAVVVAELRRAGNRRKGDDERDLRLAQIERMTSWGWTNAEIAKDLKVSPRQITRDRSLIRYRNSRQAVAS